MKEFIDIILDKESLKQRYKIIQEVKEITSCETPEEYAKAKATAGKLFEVVNHTNDNELPRVMDNFFTPIFHECERIRKLISPFLEKWEKKRAAIESATEERIKKIEDEAIQKIALIRKETEQQYKQYNNE